MRNDSWHDTYQESKQKLEFQVDIFIAYKNNLISKYPLVGNEIKWDLEYILGKKREEDDPDIIIFNIFDHIESYSKWRKELNDIFDHQRLQSINLRIDKLNIILNFLDSDIPLIILAENEMKPNLLMERKILQNLKIEQLSNLKELSIELENQHEELSKNGTSQDFTAKSNENELDPTVYIKPSHLVYALCKTGLLPEKGKASAFCKEICTHFLDKNTGKGYNEKSFLNAIRQTKRYPEKIPKKLPSNDLLDSLTEKLRTIFPISKLE